MTPSNNKRQLIIITGLIVAAIVVFACFVLDQIRRDPDVLFLTNQKDAQWIKFDREFKLTTIKAGQISVKFRRHFKTTTAIDNAGLFVRALKSSQVILDGKVLYDSQLDFDNWKKLRRISIPSPMQPGIHELIIIVTSYNSSPALLVYSDNLPIKTGQHWTASKNDTNWTPAIAVSRIKPASFSREFPSSTNALRTILPWLVPVFVIIFGWSMLYNPRIYPLTKLNPWHPKPRYVCWAMLILWTVMAVNNMFKLDARVGYDLLDHLKYIDYIVVNHSLPLADKGWQMFQSPLYYIISAPLFALFKNSVEITTVAKLLRIIPLVCGLIQIEIVYRAARIVFPKKNDLQIIATVVGSLIPMHIYICQVVGNEPLAGCLTSWLILLVLSLLTPHQTKRHFLFFVLIGAVLGLALLSKVTAVLLVLPLVIALVFHSRAIGQSIKHAAINISVVFGVCFITSGWYFIRNWLVLGKPFIGGWDQSRGMQWWQDPGYRTWSQTFAFGESMIYPVFSGIMGFFDAVYSTFWLDGFYSGILCRLQWNVNFMVAGALLAVTPTVLLFIGFVAPLRNSMKQSRKTILFSTFCIAIYLTAIFYLYIKLPIYSTAKATYTLGLLPCYALLAAAGAEPFLKHRLIRSFLFALLACWAFAAYLAYFAYHFANLEP